MSETKVVILAGGMGLRLFEETITTPKPMVEIEGKPIIWHVMSRFANFGYTDFVICLGYKSSVISSYFFDLEHVVLEDTNQHKRIELENKWRVNLVETGADTMTAGRVKRVQGFLGNDFFLCYSDNISDIDISKLYAFHKNNPLLCTLTVINPRLNYGVVIAEDSMVTGFVEKPVLEDTIINAGYFVCKKELIGLIESDASVFEVDVMSDLVARKQLNAYKHNGFWRSVDTYKDLTEIRQLPVSQLIKNE